MLKIDFLQLEYLVYFLQEITLVISKVLYYEKTSWC